MSTPATNSLLATSFSAWLGSKPISSNAVAVSAGSADSNSVVFWAKGEGPFEGWLTYQPSINWFSNRSQYPQGLYRYQTKNIYLKSNGQAGDTIKFLAGDLLPGTTYNYSFKPAGETLFGQIPIALEGRVQTAPLPADAAAVRFGFGSCADGRYAPFDAISTVTSQNLDFFVIQGDAIYEDGSKLSPEVLPPLNPDAPYVLDAQRLQQSVEGLQRKFLENIRPSEERIWPYSLLSAPLELSSNGNLAPLYRSTGIYATYDNHEMADTALESGGGPADALSYVSWSTPSRSGGFFREGADLSAANLVNRSGSFINQREEFKGLLQTWFQNMPERDRGTIRSNDPRDNGTQQLYYAQQWGKHAVLINVDDRSYRDIKITAVDTNPDGRKSEDDVTGWEIDRPDSAGRTILGATQLAWLKQTLLQTQANGTTWKFISLSSPIDITGRPGDDGKPERGELSVDAKSWWGNYRHERQELLQFIADNGIKNVVFLAGDDHEARVNEVTYAPDGVIDNLTGYIPVPYAFTFVSSPIGALRPQAFVDAAAQKDPVTGAPQGLQGIVNKIEASMRGNPADPLLAPINPYGLDQGFPGLKNLTRTGISGYTADVNNPSMLDFYSPDTFNYGLIDVNPQGELTASLWGIPPTQINSFETVPAPIPTPIFSFSIDPTLA